MDYLEEGNHGPPPASHSWSGSLGLKGVKQEITGIRYNEMGNTELCQAGDPIRGGRSEAKYSGKTVRNFKIFKEFEE